jgi:hypothetical protein
MAPTIAISGQKHDQHARARTDDDLGVSSSRAEAEKAQADEHFDADMFQSPPGAEHTSLHHGRETTLPITGESPVLTIHRDEASAFDNQGSVSACKNQESVIAPFTDQKAERLLTDFRVTSSTPGASAGVHHDQRADLENTNSSNRDSTSVTGSPDSEEWDAANIMAIPAPRHAPDPIQGNSKELASPRPSKPNMPPPDVQTNPKTTPKRRATIPPIGSWQPLPGPQRGRDELMLIAKLLPPTIKLLKRVVKAAKQKQQGDFTNAFRLDRDLLDDADLAGDVKKFVHSVLEEIATFNAKVSSCQGECAAPLLRCSLYARSRFFREDSLVHQVKIVFYPL